MQRIGLLIICLLLVSACMGSDQFGVDASEVFKPCDKAALKAAATGHGMQHVFEACGSNEFKDFAWSADGADLYIRGEAGPWLRRNASGEFYSLPLGKPLGSVVWINGNLLAYPSPGKRSAEINIYDVEQRALHLIGISQVEPNQLALGEAADDVLFVAREAADKPRNIYRLSANTAAVEPAFSWLTPGPIHSFTYRRRSGPDSKGIACIGWKKEGTVSNTTCHQASNGEQLWMFPHKTRASVSKDGMFVMLEGDGPLIPAFKTPEAAASAPNYLPREVTPEGLWLYEVSTAKEQYIKGLFGHSFQWYDATNYWGSFLLWGFNEGHTNGNVIVGDFTGKLSEFGMDTSSAGKKAADPPAEAPAEKRGE